MIGNVNGGDTMSGLANGANTMSGLAKRYGQRNSTWLSRALVMSLLVGSLASGPAASGDEPDVKRLQSALTFYASFDDGTDADLARGDGRIQTAASFDQIDASQPGFHTRGMTVPVPTAGIGGSGALHFQKRDSPVVFFLADKNVAYRQRDWSGTISLWLRVDPQSELAPGFCDPIQVTTRAWNDGSFFVDFNKDGNPRDFRLGAYPDHGVWNPEGRAFEDVAIHELPLVPVKSPPFSKDRWTHVLFTWHGYNTGDRQAVTRFYLNGELRGELTGREQTFGWNEGEVSRMFLGIYYQGLLDDVACFDRDLTEGEVRGVYQAQNKLKP